MFRYPRGLCRRVEQLQPVPHQDHPVAGDHHGPHLQVRLRLQLHGAGARLHTLPRVMQGEILIN